MSVVYCRRFPPDAGVLESSRREPAHWYDGDVCGCGAEVAGRECYIGEVGEDIRQVGELIQLLRCLQSREMP